MAFQTYLCQLYNQFMKVLKARVTSPDGETDYFKIYAGDMQGDTLAPFLFIIVLDYAIRKAIQGKKGTWFYNKPNKR